MNKNKAPQKRDNWFYPETFEVRVDNLVRRAEIVKSLREFFDKNGYVEVETPALQVSPGLEPFLRAMETSLTEPNGDQFTLYLHSSPEFAMKKLLSAGMKRIFQICNVYRDGERSRIHHPEFTMLEWYKVGADWRSIAEEAIELIRAVCGSSARQGDHICDLLAVWEFMSVPEAFERFAKIDILETMSSPLEPDTDALRCAADGIGIRTAASDGWDDVFFRIFLEKVEPNLGITVPTILHSYPASMAALSKISPTDYRLSERFEIFICGMELANGYEELTDGLEQRTRFADTLKQRRLRGLPIYPIDEDFILALESGIPDCAGIALGLDRLVMLATGADMIAEVLWAPVSGS